MNAPENNTIDVRYVAALARLDIAEESVPKLQRDMNAIVEYINELNELDVSGIEPTAHATMRTNVIRDDVAGEPFGRAMLQNAPELLHGELIKVPRVLPGEEM